MKLQLKMKDFSADTNYIYAKVLPTRLANQKGICMCNTHELSLSNMIDNGIAITS